MKIEIIKFKELFYEQNLPAKDIADYFGVKTQSVSSFRLIHNLPARGWSKAPWLGKKRSKETIEKITKSRKGKCTKERNHNWNGGTYTSHHGYKMVYSDRMKADGKYPYIQEHRHIMEKRIGRTLLSSEIVHHINGDKLDNRIENLVIVSRSSHGKLHGNQYAPKI